MLPFVIPGSVLAMALIFAFGEAPLYLMGTSLIMVLAFVIRRMPYTVRSSTAIVSQISPSTGSTVISPGASERRTFFRVVVPMMMPGVLAGAIMSWMTILGELSASIILYSTNTQTLAVSIYTEVIRGNFGNASAYSAILTVTSILSLFLFFKLTGKKEMNV